jgi:hypothetical protein
MAGGFISAELNVGRSHGLHALRCVIRPQGAVTLEVCSGTEGLPECRRRRRIASCALSDLGVPAGPVERPELALEELARSGARQLAGEVH